MAAQPAFQGGGAGLREKKDKRGKRKEEERGDVAAWQVGPAWQRPKPTGELAGGSATR
jgi:hypothetical protein